MAVTFQRDTIFQRRPDLRLQLDPSGSLAVENDETATWYGPHALRILDAFARPTTAEAGLRRVKRDVVGKEDLQDAVGTFFALLEAGVISEPGVRIARVTPSQGFSGAAAHAEMLSDRTRTSAFIRAIQEVVKPGDIVLEIGTGTGVLATAAAKAGARMVYAIEPGAMGRVAREVYAANGVADRVTLIEGWSTHVDLPERANVLIAEMIGNDPFEEGIIPAIADARARLLHDDARLIPSDLSAFAVPVEVASEVLCRTTFDPEVVQTWSDQYGIDFSPLARAAAGVYQSFYAGAVDGSRIRLAGDPERLFRVDFRDAVGTEQEAGIIIAKESRANAVLICLESRLSPGIVLSTDPRVVAADNHWKFPVWPIDSSIRNRGACEVRFRLQESSRIMMTAVVSP